MHSHVRVLILSLLSCSLKNGYKTRFYVFYFNLNFFFNFYNTDKGEYCINQNSFQEENIIWIKSFLEGLLGQSSG